MINIISVNLSELSRLILNYTLIHNTNPYVIMNHFTYDVIEKYYIINKINIQTVKDLNILFDDNLDFGIIDIK